MNEFLYLEFMDCFYSGYFWKVGNKWYMWDNVFGYSNNGILWNNCKYCFVNVNILWEIFKMVLLWQIWVEKCGYELNLLFFNFGVVFFNVWKIKIYVGMECWKLIYRIE